MSSLLFLLLHQSVDLRLLVDWRVRLHEVDSLDSGRDQFRVGLDCLPDVVHGVKIERRVVLLVNKIGTHAFGPPETCSFRAEFVHSLFRRVDFSARVDLLLRTPAGLVGKTHRGQIVHGGAE